MSALRIKARKSATGSGTEDEDAATRQLQSPRASYLPPENLDKVTPPNHTPLNPAPLNPNPLKP